MFIFVGIELMRAQVFNGYVFCVRGFAFRVTAVLPPFFNVVRGQQGGFIILMKPLMVLV